MCRACSIAWGCKSPAQPDGGEVLAKRKGYRREAGSEGSVERQSWSDGQEPDMRPFRAGERAYDREAHIHQAPSR